MGQGMDGMNESWEPEEDFVPVPGISMNALLRQEVAKERRMSKAYRVKWERGNARIAELEAALEAKHQQYVGAVIQLAEARKDGERYKAVVDMWFTYVSLDGTETDDIELMLTFGKAADATKAARGTR